MSPVSVAAAAVFSALWTAACVRAAAGLEPSIDLLEALQLHNSSRQGVSSVPGPQGLRPAVYLQGDFRDLRLPQSLYQKVAERMRHNPEFTLAASVKQEVDNSGTIVSFSHGFTRYLEVQSSGRKDEVRLHFVPQQQQQQQQQQHEASVHVESFPYRLADNTWHKLAVSVSGSQVELLVDCHPLYRRFVRPPDRNFSSPQMALWLGQRNSKHSLFKGALQDVRLIFGPHGYLSQCPSLDSTCPTCGQFSLLQGAVDQLRRNLQDLTDRLAAAEGRIGVVEQCDCRKSCRSEDGLQHEDGSSWRRGCDTCTCTHGVVECRPVQCPNITCKHPVTNPGECCPSCLKQCLLRGELYDHGVSVSLQCVECECRDGSMRCSRIKPETMCPPLPCPVSHQFSVPGNCCKFCRDVDECLQEGGEEGHHCHSNTRCVNTHGSYVCECLPGYRRQDKFNCVEMDECVEGKHDCHPHADCVNVLGSYHCACRPGYSGDGYSCQPVCNQTCLNGGECRSPGVCSCRKGYSGGSCELDLDECASNLHRCNEHSVCVNMPGWYYCKCKAGFRSIFKGDTLGTTCEDIDECGEGLHTCYGTARCENTDGGFRCSCPAGDAACKLSCSFEGRELEDGSTARPAADPCRLCECSAGVLACRDPACNCSGGPPAHEAHCCPQCSPDKACQHQELLHVSFRSGERWVYQCQTCECLLGETDCWPMECPPLTCSEPVLAAGDCCPRCADDPCALDDASSSSAVAAPGQPCTYEGRLYDSGNQWRPANDKCTACSCKDGRLCCSYDFQCSAGVVAERRRGLAGPAPRGVAALAAATGAPQAGVRPTAEVATPAGEPVGQAPGR
ncbi:protein kinase C-binding protein NELL1-like isoform X2 [Bacillus rossius redtenbacheri]|uniref:protein kinase C-binding protein NELL1-like isoform X2 n=1 Tax=Bacillus rossius redtenbacheri TaxID=93214 RepID=UPI002FDC9B1A